MSTDKLNAEFSAWFSAPEQAELRLCCSEGWAEYVWRASRAKWQPICCKEKLMDNIDEILAQLDEHANAEQLYEDAAACIRSLRSILAKQLSPVTWGAYVNGDLITGSRAYVQRERDEYETTCVDDPDFVHEVAFPLYTAPPSSEQPECRACAGHGIIGGFVSAESGYDAIECPQCAGTGYDCPNCIAAAEQHGTVKASP